MVDCSQRAWRPRNLDLEITARCNLGCTYCYLGRNTTGEQRGDMGREVADQVLEYTRLLADHHEPLCGPTARIAWHLFGGEPFLAFETVRYLVTEAERRNLPVDVAIFTNGASASPEQVAWCKSHRITPKRSTGGCPEACVATRPGDYLGRYEVETRLWNDYGLPRRITLVPETACYLMRTVKYFYDRGYWGGLDFVCDQYATWSAAAVATLKDQLDLLAREFVRQFRAGRMLWNEQIQQTARRLFGTPKLHLGCGAGWGLQAITWDGYVVPCHRFLRDPRDSAFCGGRLSDLLAGRGPSFGERFADHVDGLSRGEEPAGCQSCSARTACWHGCYHVSWKTCGTLDRSPAVHCELTRHYVELAKWVHSELAEMDARWFDCAAQPCEPIVEEAT